jgi:hypothetical protein
VDSLSEAEGNKLIWVKLDMRWEPHEDSVGYLHFGQIAYKNLVNIRNDKEVKLISLSNIRYLDKDYNIDIYEDEDIEGEYVFDPELVVKMRILKKDPLEYEPDSLLSKKAIQYKNDNYK